MTDLYKINLLPPEIIAQRKYEGWYPWIAAVTVIALIVIGIAFGWATITLAGQNSELESLKGQVAVVKSQAEELKQYETQYSEYVARQEVVDRALSDRLDPYLLSLTVTKYLPANVWISSVAFSSEEGFVLTGNVQDVGTNPNHQDWRGVAQCVDDLEASALLQNCWLTTGSMVDTFNDGELASTNSSATQSTTTGGGTSPTINTFTIQGQLRFTQSLAKDVALWSGAAEEGASNE